MKSWFKKFGQKLYGKKPEQSLKSKNKKTRLKEKKLVDPKIQETPTPMKKNQSILKFKKRQHQLKKN